MALNRFDIRKKDLPELPGVYMMKENDKIIYVGKAKNLKNRVSSYFNREHEDEKTKKLVSHIENIEIIICNSELDALILENNLIKKYIPKYNILLKDEKTYPYIKISREKFPNIKIIRTTKALDTKNGDYFGPYPFGAWGLKKALVRIFKIRDCNRDMKKIYPRPCLKYYMKMCPGPCHYKKIDKEYNIAVEKAKKLLKGKGNEIIKELKKSMEDASQKMDFERAIFYREEIKEIENIKVNQVNEYGKEMDEDVFNFRKIGDLVFICVLNIRNGKMFGKVSTNISLKNKIYENLTEEIIRAFYYKHPAPKDIILDMECEKDLENIKYIFEEQKNIKFYFPKIKSTYK